MKIVYMGTPDFAAHILSELLKEGRHEIIAVVTQPDKPRDRGVISASPVKELALKHSSIAIFQYEKISKEAFNDARFLTAMSNADICVTAAYGQILSQEIIDLASIPEKKKHGIINVHASLLPRYRGAAPIQWAVIKGETETGISIMKTEAGLDCGPVLLAKKTALGETETAGQLFDRLKDLGAECLKEALDIIESGKAEYIKQDESKATFFPPLRKTDGEIDFGKPAAEIAGLIRGVNPWPGAYTYFNDAVLKIWTAEAMQSACHGDGVHADGKKQVFAAPMGHSASLCVSTPSPMTTTPAPPCVGQVISSDKNGVLVECGNGVLKLLEIQAAGGKRMLATEFIKGKPIIKGTIFCKQL